MGVPINRKFLYSLSQGGGGSGLEERAGREGFASFASQCAWPVAKLPFFAFFFSIFPTYGFAFYIDREFVFFLSALLLLFVLFVLCFFI